MIVGQVGGGLGSGGTSTASPTHAAQQTTWPVADRGPTNTPVAQLPRVQSFGTEVAAVAPGREQTASTALTWSNLRPGTYLIESGTHPSIQATMGLYGILVVTTPATPTAARRRRSPITLARPRRSPAATATMPTCRCC